MSRKTLAVDSDTIDEALDELTKLMLRLDKNPKKTRKETEHDKENSRDSGYDTGFGPLCEIEKELTVKIVLLFVFYRSRPRMTLLNTLTPSRQLMSFQRFRINQNYFNKCNFL